MAERVLVTGGTGNTGSLVVSLLRERGVDAVPATRDPTREGEIRINWSDPETFAPALEGSDAVYLVAPTDRAGHLAAMRPFLELAIERVTGPLVLLSAAALPPGGPMMGEVHAWLRDHAPRWAALRPSWFMQNFTGQHLAGIMEEGRVYSATGDGRVAFIDALDIAAVAVRALVEPERASGELVVTGPEPLSYDDVAEMISRVARRPVEHRRLDVGGLADRYRSFGLPDDYATLLAGMDEDIASGAEDRTTDVVERVTGRPPTSFGDFLARNADRFREPETKV